MLNVFGCSVNLNDVVLQAMQAMHSIHTTEYRGDIINQYTLLRQ